MIFIRLFYSGGLSSNGDAENNLRQILYAETQSGIRDWVFADFNGDGMMEAFATINNTDEPEYSSSNDFRLWFVSTKGAWWVPNTDNGYLSRTIQEGKYQFVIWKDYSGTSYCFGVNDNGAYQLEISAVNIIKNAENGKIYAVSGASGLNGRIFRRHYEVTFDENLGEFIKTGTYYDEIFPQVGTSYDAESNGSPDSYIDDGSVLASSNYFENDPNSQMNDLSDIIKSGLEHFEASPLYDIAIKELPGTITAWAYDDFDNDGENEAFIRIQEQSGSGNYDTSGSIWYVSRSYTSRLIASGYPCFLTEDSIFDMRNVDMKIAKFVKIYARHGYSEVYTVRNGVPFVINVEGYYYDICKYEDTDMVIGISYEWNEYTSERLWYGEILFLDSGISSLTPSGHTVSLDNSDWIDAD